MSYRFAVLLIFCFLLMQNSIAQQPADEYADAKTREILAYLVDVPKRGKVLSDQFAGYSPDTFTMDWIDQIYKQTGQVPAILGCDWACGWNHRTPSEWIVDYSCNPFLKEHWKKGGLITVNMHLPNPSTLTGGGFKTGDSFCFPDLLNPYSDIGQRWDRFLDRIAQGLEDLQRAGVTVLLRPFHEMNGDWFYWGGQDFELFKTVWRHMFDYITKTRQIHNVLWVYSPDQSRSGPSRYYPGDSYVDIVALDAYTNDPMSMNGYDEMIALNKPFALGEIGPPHPNGQYDFAQWIHAIESRFPRVIYFFAWNDAWAPTKNLNAYAYLNHPRVINLGQFNLSNAGTGSTDDSLSSSILHNFSQGVGGWHGSNLIGGSWQSNEFTSKGLDSLKGDIYSSWVQQYYMFSRDSSIVTLNDKKGLTCEVRVAPWGFSNGGTISAKLYIKVGSSWQWYDSDATVLSNGNSGSLTLDLSQILSNDLTDIK